MTFALRATLLVVALFLLGACTPKANAVSPSPAAAAVEDDGSVAPELDGGTAWLNTDRPLSLANLRGHVVVLDFWTYCCVNCLHVLPELERLERRFAGKPVVVIGVHSGKFDAEKDAKRIRAAMARHGVSHPVVVDNDFHIWNRYGVSAWPTLAVIDPDGYLVGTMAGEPPAGALGELVDALLRTYGKAGKLAKEPIAIHAPAPLDTGPLAFPGKVAVASTGDVAIADSGHHRIIIADRDGRVRSVAGSGIAGSADGQFDEAAFDYPQGLVFDSTGRYLYVADTNNHQLRLLDLANERVTAIAGTGTKGTRSDGGPALETALRSPWALALDDEQLFIAMAGSHQIWRMRLNSGRISPFAGTGREHIDDGPIERSTFSQPSGLALFHDQLFVADSEVSAIRAIDLRQGEVRTLVGTGLFDFGDRDGRGADAKLQHALGVAMRGDQLYVADTFNNKIKRLDPVSGELVTIAGGASSELFEPGGLALLPDGQLLIADTNNHRLRVLDPSSNVLEDFTLSDLEPPAAVGLVLASGATTGHGTKQAPIPVTASGLLGSGRGTLLIDVTPPAHGKLTDGAPLRVIASAKTNGVRFPTPKVRTKIAADTLPIRVPVDIVAGGTTSALIELAYYWCTSGDEAACIPVRAHLDVTLEVDDSRRGGEVRIHHQAERR